MKPSSAVTSYDSPVSNPTMSPTDPKTFLSLSLSLALSHTHTHTHTHTHHTPLCHTPALHIHHTHIHPILTLMSVHTHTHTHSHPTCRPPQSRRTAGQEGDGDPARGTSRGKINRGAPPSMEGERNKQRAKAERVKARNGVSRE